MGIEKMKNMGLNTAMKNIYFQKISSIKNCFPIIHKNCPEYELKKAQKTFL